MNRYVVVDRISSPVLWILLAVMLVWLAAWRQAFAQPLRVTPASAAENESHVRALGRAGAHWAAELKAQEEKLDAAFKQLNHAMSLMKVDPLDGARLAITEVRSIVKDLKKQATAVVADHQQVLQASESYRESIDRIAPMLLTAAGTLEEYARTEPFEDLAKDYLLWADVFRSIAAKYDSDRVRRQPAADAVADNLAYVKRTALMLERLDILLAIPPEDDADVELLLRRLASYVESFERFRRELRKLHEAVVDPEAEKATPQRSEEEATDTDRTAGATFRHLPQLTSRKFITARFVSNSRPPSTGRNSAYAHEVLIDEQFVEQQDIVKVADTQAEEPPHDGSSDKATGGLPTRSPDSRSEEELARKRREMERKEREIEQKRREMAQRKIPPHEDILPYLGTWKVSPGNVTIQLSSGGGNRATASLVRSPAILSASGEFRLEGKELVAMDYRYRLATGDWLDLSGTRFRLTGHNRLAAVGPKYTRNSSGGFERLYRSSHRYTLTQTTDAIRPAYYQTLKY